MALTPLAVEKMNQAVTYAYAEVGGFAHGRIRNVMIDALDAQLLRLTLSLHAGNQVQTAKALGINRNTLRKRMKRCGVIT